MSVEWLGAFAARCRDELGWEPSVIDLGGGLGIRYLEGDRPPAIGDFVKTLLDTLEQAWELHGLDAPDVIRKKFKTAVTDSGTDVRHDPDEKPGISNLIEIMAVATGTTISDVESRYDGQGYGTFKGDVGEAVVELLAPIQQRYEDLRADEAELRRLLARGADKAREASAPTIEAMYERMGFVRP